ncbi:hypothetical protein [Streptomyces johnsoniae]|uniref:Uncharacterized protein n=1 Tax=Streptomyces johnsoniae TaxID=3075532 RepID=A0ABU2SB42_9ACTN|nr:hypothetical protein [Streptomyces sp. DSM 41886]MDT0445064.1 hypothetical protein [Streptomyces sp. DSM 41886]
MSEPERVTPDGLGDAIMECRMFDLGEGSEEGQNGLAPMCVWADGSPVGTTIRGDAMTRGG